MDTDGDGEIDLSEFTFAKTAEKVQGSKNLEIFFEKLDKDGDGKITRDEIKEVFGDSIDNNELNQIFLEIDKDNDGEITLDEFKKAMYATDFVE